MDLTKIKNIFIISLVFTFIISGMVLSYNEAPELEEKVQDGELPPVEERLPEDPYVVEPVEKIGDYGGVWNSYIQTAGDTKLLTTSSNINLLKWDKEFSKLIPDLAKDYKASEDGKSFTFYLREGLKWSDGEPFTAEDIVFWFEDIIGNDEITPSKPGYLQVGGELCELEKIDEYTIRFKFPKPQGMFLLSLVSDVTGGMTDAPKHYLKQFHEDYVSEEELSRLVEESEYDTWYDLFVAKANYYSNHNPDLPTMKPWIPTNEPPAENFNFKRNPYFWKVDTEGNQLPYINNLRMRLVQDGEVVNMRTVAGEPDFQFRDLQIANYTLFKENEEEGNYEVLLWETDNMAAPAIFPNHNTDDSVLRELFRNNKFKQALSLGINRPQINNVVYKGLGQPIQANAIPSFAGMKEEYLNAYAEYNPEKANQMLDELGLEEKNNKGIRLRSDGEPLTITVITAGESPQHTDVLELVKEQWKEIGVEIVIRNLERSLFRLRMQSGNAEMGIWDYQFRPSDLRNFVPNIGNTYWAPKWGIWYQSGEEEIEIEADEADEAETVSGEEPPEQIKELQNIFDELKINTDEEKRSELYSKLFKAQAENLWGIGTVGLLPSPLIKKPHFRNVPEESLFSWYYGKYLSHLDPAHFFIEKEAQN